MKIRLASSHLAARLHRTLHTGHHWRDHEGILRTIQLVLIVVLALVFARLIAEGALLGLRAISGFLS